MDAKRKKKRTKDEAAVGGTGHEPGPASTGEVIKKKLKCQISYNENREDASFEIDLETYMKLKYNLNNQNWLCQKRKILNDQYPGMVIEYERNTDVMIINLDVNKSPGLQSSIVDNTVKALMQTTDHLFVNSLAIGGIDKTQVVEIINEHYIVRDRDLYVECDNDWDYLHYVCPPNVRPIVDVLFQMTTKQLSGPKKNIKFDKVYKEIFKKTGMLEKIKSENRPLQVSLRDENDDEFVCMLHGCNKDVTWAENLINTEIIYGHGFAFLAIKDIKHSDQFEKSELSDLVEEYLQNNIDPNIIYHFNRNGISICGPAQGNVDRYVTTIKQMLKMKTVSIENEDIAITQLIKYVKEVRATIDKPIVITVLGNNQYQVKMVGPKDIIELVETRLLEKINHTKNEAPKYKVIESTNKIHHEDNKDSELTCEKKTIWIKDYDVFTHICAKEDLPQLAQMHAIKSGKLEVKKTKTSQGFCVTGGTHRHESLKKYLNQYVCEDIALSLNERDELPDVLHEVERNHNVTLKVEDTPGPPDIEGASGGCNEAIPVSKAAAEKKVDKTKWEFPGGHCLIVVNDDANNCWKDVLVDVKIVDSVNSSSDTKVYEVVSGKRKTALHIFPWMGGGKKEKHILQQELERMLKLTQTYDCIDLCIPITQVGKWPIGKYIKLMLYALQSHLLVPNMLPVTVQLCTGDKLLFTECSDVAKQFLPGSLETSQKFKVKKQYIKVNVVKGKLDTIKADIIVNTTNHSLQLKNGAVSYSLLRKAGKNLQEECNRNHNGNINSGQIVMTKGYGLDCRHVFHSALDVYNGSAVSIENLVVDCLKKAAYMKYESIAFPAIGTGNLSYPKHEVAAAMFDGVERFEQECCGSSVKEAEFVVYYADQKAVTEFEKYQRQYNSDEMKAGPSSTTHDPNASETIMQGRINVKARLGTLSNCKTHAIVYLWEKAEFHGANYYQHCLLKATGRDVQKQFDDHRKKKGDDKYKVFSTLGGTIQLPVIVHAPCTDTYDSIRAALWDSVLLLEKEKMKTASIWFPARHPFLRHGDNLTEVLVAVVKEVQQSVVCLSDICIVVEGKHNLRKIFQFFRIGGKSVTIKIIGKQNEIERAKEDLQHYIATGNLKTMSVDDKPRSPTLPPTVPEGTTTQRGIEDVSSPGAPRKQPDIPDTYVAIENIPLGYTLEKLGAALYAARIPILPPKLVYMDGSTNGIAICNSTKDANQLVGFKGIPGVRFKPQPKVHKDSTCTINSDKNKKQFILEQLKNIHVNVKEKGDNQLLIVAQTAYQIQFAKTICSESTSHVRHQTEFEYVETINVIPEVWEIVRNLKKENFQVLEDSDAVKIKFKDNILTIEWSAAVIDGDDIRNNFEVLHSCCRSLQGKEIEEIPLDRYDEDKTQKWCIEVQETLDMKCCLHIPKQKKVFAYCDTYNDIQRVKHEFLIKEGKVKPSGRRRRHMEVSDPPADIGHAVFSSAHTKVQSKFGGEKHYEGNQTEKHQHKQLSLPTNNPEDSESIKTFGISPDHSSDGPDNSEAVFTEKNKDGYANKDDINASSQDDEIADSDILGSITTTNPVVGVVAGSDMLGSIRATKPAGATFGGSNASEMLGIITTTKPIVQGATGSDMIGSIKTARRNVQSTSDSSEEEEEDIQLDTFGIVVRCKKRKGGHSTVVLKAQNTEEALKWRYILSKNQHHRFKHELENVCNSVNIRIESNVAEIDCENNKPSIIEETVKKIITQETIDLRVKEFRINIEQCRKVEEVLTSNSPDFTDQTASLFMESNKCYLVSPAHVFEANIEVFQQTHDFFSTLLRSQATKRKN